MAQRLLKSAETKTNGPCLDDYDEDQVKRVAIEAYMQAVTAWKLSDSEAEKMLDVGHQDWEQIKKKTWKGSLSRMQLKRIGAVIAIHDALHSCFGEKMADRWATEPNMLPMFHGRKPVDAMIEEGLPMMKKAQRLTYELLGDV
ncbi:MAG: DUF2384 domain-containing protein [Hyphomicrobiales bacterium]|nr:DUF2384 domain-containing protein [Hyphomicrobiales bacterium]